MMQQMALALNSPPHPSLDQFLGPHQELIFSIQRLPLLAYQEKAAFQTRLLHIYGDSATGKTHILQACAYEFMQAGLKSIYLTPSHSMVHFEFKDEPILYCLDDVDQMNEAQQMAVFNLFNEARLASHTVIISSTKHRLMELTDMRDDLRTRLAWGLSYRLQALNTEEKKIWLRTRLAEKNMHVDEAVLMHLLDYAAENMNDLKDILIFLDHISLEQKKRLSLHFIKKTLSALKSNQNSSALFLDDTAASGF